MDVRITVHLEGLADFGAAYPQQLPPFEVGPFSVVARPVEGEPSWLNSRAWYLARCVLSHDSKFLNPPSTYAAVDALITCFRLFKPGYIGANPFYMEPRAEGGWGRPVLPEGRSALSQSGGRAYPLSADEAPRLADFAKAVYPTVLSGLTGSASPVFQFFNRGIDDEARNEPSLAVVDFVSCMEAQLISTNAEVSHRFSELVSIVTERDRGKRRDRYRLCKDIYDKRSAVIHGNAVGEPQALASQAEGLARYVVRFALGYSAKGKGKKELVEDAAAVLFAERADFPEFAFDNVQGLAT